MYGKLLWADEITSFMILQRRGSGLENERVFVKKRLRWNLDKIEYRTGGWKKLANFFPRRAR